MPIEFALRINANEMTRVLDVRVSYWNYHKPRPQLHVLLVEF